MDEFLDGIFSWIFTYILTPIINVLGDFFKYMLSGSITRIIFALLFTNLLGLFLMYHDKKVAERNGKTKSNFAKENNLNLDNLSKEDERALKKQLERRTPESTFLLISALFGSAGILGGMYLFRHKTKKKKFIYGVPAIIVVHVILIIWTLVSARTKQ